jgi:hypothetical protein
MVSLLALPLIPSCVTDPTLLECTASAEKLDTFNSDLETIRGGVAALQNGAAEVKSLGENLFKLCAKVDESWVLNDDIEKDIFKSPLTCGDDGPGEIQGDPGKTRLYVIPMQSENWTASNTFRAPSKPPPEYPEAGNPPGALPDVPGVEQPPDMPQPAGSGSAAVEYSEEPTSSESEQCEAEKFIQSSTFFSGINAEGPSLDLHLEAVDLRLPAVEFALPGVIAILLCLDVLLMIRRVLTVLAKATKVVEGIDEEADSAQRVFDDTGRPLSFDPVAPQTTEDRAEGAFVGLFSFAAWTGTRVQWAASKFPILHKMFNLSMILAGISSALAFFIFIIFAVLQEGVLENIGYVQLVVYPVELNVQGTNQVIVTSAFRTNSGELRNVELESQSRKNAVYDDTVDFNQQQLDLIAPFVDDYKTLKDDTIERVNQYRRRARQEGGVCNQINLGPPESRGTSETAKFDTLMTHATKVTLIVPEGGDSVTHIRVKVHDDKLTQGERLGWFLADSITSGCDRALPAISVAFASLWRPLNPDQPQTLFAGGFKEISNYPVQAPWQTCTLSESEESRLWQAQKKHWNIDDSGYINVPVEPPIQLDPTGPRGEDFLIFVQ